ncbi:MAG: glycosyltransferase [Candidatus Binatus sp.]|uniref:glycosyltransferase n=1 Tax=Candidatus Binatus sp. TaxID=2811406 RepID=UPI003C71C866
MIWHLITGEYPPAIGGVGDYTRQLGEALSRCGDEVHVWAPPTSSPTNEAGPVRVHRLPDSFGPRSMLAMDRGIDRRSKSQVLVQYVPHALGWKAMNVPLCLWLASRQRERLGVMFHEVAFAISRDQLLRHNFLGVVTRAMAAILARSARRIFVTTSAWEPMLRSISGTRQPILCIPTFSNVPVVEDEAGANDIRRRVAPDGGKIVGHFGGYGSAYSAGTTALLAEGLAQHADLVVLLIGKGGTEFRAQMIDRHPSFANRLHATGALSPADASRSLAACDLMIQFYPDGVSTRRTSCMAALEHGRPVMTTSGHLTEPLWQESRAVALAPANDLPAMAAVVHRLIDDGEERQRLGTAARELYDRRFDIRHAVAALRASFNGAE